MVVFAAVALVSIAGRREVGDMRPRLEYQPALDGVRAVAVAMVLLFHGGIEWMRGGYIGVSVFFTLSGLPDHEPAARRVGRHRYRTRRRVPRPSRPPAAPGERRVHRGVALCSRYGLLDGVAHLERDLLGAAFQVQNWVLLASGDSYTEVLATVGGQRSPLEHYWSLAIEEQFYWMWPLVFGWLATRQRGAPAPAAAGDDDRRRRGRTVDRRRVG